MSELIRALRSYTQADADGVMVKVSRQACDEAADRIAALESALAANTLPCGHHHSLMLKSAETGDPLYCELCDLRAQRNDLEIELAAIQRVAEQYQDEAGTLAHELAAKTEECERLRVDAERYRWLRSKYEGADFRYGEDERSVLTFTWTHAVMASLDAAIDAARKDGTK